MAEVSKSPTLSFDYIVHTLGGRLGERGAATTIAVAQIAIVTDHRSVMVMVYGVCAVARDIQTVGLCVKTEG